MKRNTVIFIFSMLLSAALIGCAGTGNKTTPGTTATPTPAAATTPAPTPVAKLTPIPPVAGTAEGLKDGTYTAESSHDNKGWYVATVTIKDGKFTAVDLVKYDQTGKKVDPAQYKYPAGVQALSQYPKQFMEKQDASKIDMISGATSTYNGFQEIMGKIRQQAK